MSPRLFGTLMLLFASLVAGAGYSLSRNEPQVMAEASVVDGNGATTESSPARTMPKADPAIRVILPSPYEVRIN
jgi:hypothetical protein